MSRRSFKEMSEEVGSLPISFLAGKPDAPCPFCKRPIVHLMKHHLVPKTLGGKETVRCCRDCHKAIHAFLPNKELKRYYHTIERLMEHEGFRKMVEWISKQDPHRKVKIERPRDQRRRGKYR